GKIGERQDRKSKKRAPNENAPTELNKQKTTAAIGSRDKLANMYYNKTGKSEKG
ncbi:hypothetical protein Tco_0437560, partial [Tanacetum coccineum]